MRPEKARTPCEGDPALFDPDSAGYYVAEAKAACGHCYRTEACLEDAMRREHRLPAAGRAMVWGGLTPTERERLARKRYLERKAS